MGSYTTFARGLSMVGGMALVGIGAYLNVADLAKMEGYLSPTNVLFYGFAGGVVLAALVWPTLQRRGLAILIVLGLACGEGYALFSTLDRLLGAREERAARIGDMNAPRELAEQAMRQARADLAEAKAKADEARSDKKCGAVCGAWQDRETQARFHIAQAEKRLLATASAREARPLAVFLAAKFGLDPAVAEFVPPLLGAAALLIMGFGLIAAGHPPASGPVAGDIEVSPPQPKRRVRRDEAIAQIRAQRDKDGQWPPFTVVQNDLNLPKATAHRYRKAAMGE